MKKYFNTLVFLGLVVVLSVAHQNCGKNALLSGMLNTTSDDSQNIDKEATLGGNPGNPIDPPCCTGGSGGNGTADGIVLELASLICSKQLKYGYIADSRTCILMLYTDIELAGIVYNNDQGYNFYNIHDQIVLGEINLDLVLFSRCKEHIRSYVPRAASSPHPENYDAELAREFLRADINNCGNFLSQESFK